MNRLSLYAAITISLTACSSNTMKGPQAKVASSYDSMDVLGQDELYFIYKKDDNGSPNWLVAVEPSQARALSHFRQESAIEKFDCIRIVKFQTIGSQASVCDEGKWFDYGLNGKTKLTTREMKDASGVVTGTVVAALSPVRAAIDILDFDFSFSGTRKDLTKVFTNPVQDFEFIRSIKPEIDRLVNQRYVEDLKQANGDIDFAISYFSKYKTSKIAMSSQDEIVAQNLQRSISENSPYKVYRISSSLPMSEVNIRNALSYLRGLNSFEGASYAFDITSSMDDANVAKSLAQNSGDKQKVEYMTMKLISNKNSLFTTSFITDLKSSDVSGVRNIGGFFVQDRNWGNADFSATMKVAAKRELGIFAYGEYRVTVRSTLTVKKHLYRRSAWLGNEDKDYFDTHTVDTVFVLRGPEYSAVEKIQFKGISLNFKERGSMGGITEETQIGDPVVKSEVINVTLAN